jgi:DNA-binding transcriptional LysR family regulator
MIHGTALTYFNEVARTGSLAAASQTLHVAVSAVSRQIAQLERQIGTALFERMPRGMVLTRPGEILAEHVRRTLLDADAVLAEISTVPSQARGLVRIGCDEGLTTSLLPGVLASFHRAYPLARFSVRAGAAGVVAEWVAKGEVDLGLSYSADDSAAVNPVCTVKVAVDALFRAGHPLARTPELKLADLLAYPIAIPDRDTALRCLFDRCCTAAGSNFEPLLVTDNAAVICQFTSLTDGIAVGSRIMLKGLCTQDALVARNIDGLFAKERHLRLITMQRRRLPRTVSRFLEVLKDALRDAASDTSPHPARRPEPLPDAQPASNRMPLHMPLTSSDARMPQAEVA